MRLARGQYRVVMRVPYDRTSEIHETDAEIEIPFENEIKRVWLYKLDLVPLDPTEPGGTSPEGETLAQVTIVFHVLDNTLPWVLLGRALVQGLPRALPWIAGSIGSWFVVDKVESFTTQSLVGGAIGIAAAAAGIIFLLKDQ